MLFRCRNSFDEIPIQKLQDKDRFELDTVTMACSSMVKDVFILRAFEAGADAVVVFVCPENHCRHIEGSMRARKRVDRVKNILDDIGLDGLRLTLVNLSPGDTALAEESIQKVLSDLERIGPNPAA